jgi:hypothetical protein
MYFIRYLALFAGLAVVAVTLATVAVSFNTAPIATLGMYDRPMLAEAMPMEGYVRRGPEYLSPLPQMQMLTCFGTCGAECMKYCDENYAKCTHFEGGTQYKWGSGLEPAPDYTNPTGRGVGGPDHVNWCRANLERCKGHCN